LNDFTSLKAWQQSREITKQVYLLTKKLPKEELFALSSQIRRAMISVSSNLAEGYGRRTFKDKTYFYDMAQASLNEVESQLIVSVDLGFITDEDYKNIQPDILITHKLIAGLIKSIKEIK